MGLPDAYTLRAVSESDPSKIATVTAAVSKK